MADQKKQDKIPPQKEKPEEKARDTCTALEHIELTGKCDGGKIVLAKCNGYSVTIKLLKNDGRCTLSVYCLDSNHNEIQGTREDIKPGALLPIYVAPNTTDRVIAECTRTEPNSDCKINIAV